MPIYLLVYIQLAEDLSRIQKVLVVKDPRNRRRVSLVSLFSPPNSNTPTGSLFGQNILLGIECQQRQVENEREPVAVDQEQDSEESVDSGFGDDVGVKTVAEVNGVDVVTAASNQISLCHLIQRSQLRRLTIPDRCT